MNPDTGKTFYYLLDDDKLLHICSDGMTVCGLDAKEFHEPLDETAGKYKICEKCRPLDTTLASKRKVAKFETKAELVDAPEAVRGQII